MKNWFVYGGKRTRNGGKRVQPEEVIRLDDLFGIIKKRMTGPAAVLKKRCRQIRNACGRLGAAASQCLLDCEQVGAVAAKRVQREKGPLKRNMGAVLVTFLLLVILTCFEGNQLAGREEIFETILSVMVPVAVHQDRHELVDRMQREKKVPPDAGGLCVCGRGPGAVPRAYPLHSDRGPEVSDPGGGGAPAHRTGDRQKTEAAAEPGAYAAQQRRARRHQRVWQYRHSLGGVPDALYPGPARQSDGGCGADHDRAGSGRTSGE